MATEVEYALMAGRVYQSTRATINWLPDLQSLGWTEFFLQQQPSGFEAVSFQKGNEIVISFAGTGSNVDWWANAGGFFGVTTEQLQQAADYYLQVKAANPGTSTIVSFTGHSLGGGLASLMAVFFGETAVTFDQAPFRNSASVAVATSLKDYLLSQQGYSEAALQGLTNFISAAASGGIPNESNVINFSVQGEILSAASGLRIGTPTSLTHGAPDLTLTIDLHSQGLLAAFLQSDETAPAQRSFRDVTFKLPDVVRMIFDDDLYAFSTGTQNAENENFIEHLVRHQNGIAGLAVGETVIPADSMLTRFTADLWKLAQDGGLTMTDNLPGGIFSSPPNNVSKALIAFAMQMYYEDTAHATNPNKELFTDLATANIGSGGVQFDRADVVASIENAKGYGLYFQRYLDSDAFTDTERQLMQLLLPTLRDWYVQAGAGGMTATDAHNRGAFMLGGSGIDTLTGGTKADLLVGNAGADTLDGGEGADVMIGGSGNDTYIVEDAGDQVIEGSNNGRDTVLSSVTFTFSPGDHLEHLTLTGTDNINGTGNDLNNDLIGNSGVNRLEGQGGTDHLIGGIGNDILIGGQGDNDLLEGGAGFDTYYYNNGDGNDTIIDSDGIGAVTFDVTLLTGGLRLATDPQDTWHSADGALTYVKQGADLLVNNTVTIGAFDFAGGELGIRLTTGPDTTRPSLPTIDFNNGQPSIVWEGDDSNNAPLFDAGANHIAYGRGGFDVISFIAYSEFYNHQVYGGLGNDEVDGGAGRDRLYGEQDNDVLRGWLGDDLLDGGDGVDELQGGIGNDQLFGGVGNDLIVGNNPFNPLQSGSDNDYADGGLGNDEIAGGQGDDVLLGSAGDDNISGEGVFVLGRLDRQTGDDYIDGGADNDGLTGGPGDDIILGGTGNDLLNGDNFISLPENPSVVPVWDPLVDGEDYLDGGAGDDVLHGGGYDDIVIGGQGEDRLWGDGFGYTSEPGDDWLDGGDDKDELYGGAGADTLLGGEGDDLLVGDFSTDPGDKDILDGGAGIDRLLGGGGSDVLFGGTEADLLFGESGDDVLDGGQGADELQGGDGNDVLVGGTEDDRLFGDAGTDVLDGGGGADLLVGDAGDDTMFGGEGNDQLEGGVGTDFLAGDAGNDVLIGGADADLLFGGEGNDTLQGGAGDDELTGGTGVDFLSGGAGADTYVFNLGDGVESIVDTAGEGNKLVFGAGISADDISIGIGSLVVRVGFTGDAIHIQGFDPATPTVPVGIETFEFADGTVLTQADLVARGFDLVGTAGNDSLNGGQTYRGIYGLDGDDVLTGGTIDNVLNGGSGNDILFGEGGIDQLFGGTGDDFMQGGDGNDVLNGEAGNDSLEGEAGDDVLAGGAGDDQLLGGAGNDTYHFNLGDGIDSISDSIDVTEPNRVVFGPGIASSSIMLTTNFGQILVRPGSAFEGVTIGANASDALGFHAVDLFQFEDGTSLTYTELVARGFDIGGTEFDDFLFGTNVIDRFRGGVGSDRLEGGEGNDSYFFNLGDGVDTIVDAASVGAGNEVIFGHGLASADLRLDLAPDQLDLNLSDLLIRIGAGGDAIQMDTFDRTDVLGPRTVESVRFADGSILTYEQLLARGFDLTGTEGDDQISGTNVADRMVAGDGADVLRSGAGDDTLEGGLGHDRLFGGNGNDTYEFGPGSGQDTIVEFQGEMDRIRMAPGVAPSDVVVTRNNDDLVLSLNGGADQLTVSLYFLAAPLQIELVQFADGTVWDQAFIGNLVQPTITGTGGPDVLVGTNGNDRLAGLAGDDQLTGLTGDDRLDGGTGGDQLAGGAGDDTYIVDDAGDVVIELANEGVDTVQSAVTHTLEAQVERLTLTGSAAINGTGNALDNVLTGNNAANVLTGRQGNDIYVVGLGDTVVEVVGEGTDTVQTDVSLTLGANVENLTLTGSASLTGTGNELDNVLQADGSISVLSGGAGNDLYLIGPGDDLDVIVEALDGGIDTIRASRSAQLPDHIERLELIEPLLFAVSDSDPLGNLVLPRQQPTDNQGHPLGLNGLGNAVSNTLIGTAGGNRLDGGLGADTLIGGLGDDTYVVDHANDVVIEGLGEGNDTIHSSVSTTLSSNVENLILLGSASITATGNARNNILTGNDADNVLDGGAGNDTLQGVAGADTYLFGRGSGQDFLYDFSVNGEIDTIQFTLDVAPSDVEVYRRDYSLVLVISGTTDELTLWSFFDSPGFDQKQLRFEDGTVWNESELRARAVEVGVGTMVGTTGSDTLTGGVGYDTLIGGTGDDVLSGGFGSDTLYGDETVATSFINGEPLTGNDMLLGGPGTDVLFDYYGSNLFDGGAGDDVLFLGFEHDTVLFGRGSGSDHVYFDSNGTDLDIIQLAPDLLPSDVELIPDYSDSDRLTLRIRDTDEQLVLHLSTNYPTVLPADVQGRIQFTDGTQWDLSLAPVGDPTIGTAGHDVLNGAFAGSLQGLAGDDEYRVGGAGIAGGFSVIEAAGEGTDTVQSLFEYTLDANVENLILVEVDSSVLQNPRRGTGNAMDNLIIGNTADNILDGGSGNDVLVGGLFYVEADNHLVGDNGSDILIGGEGDDTLIPFVQSTRGAGFLDLRDGFTFGESFIVNNSYTDVLPNRPDDILLGGLGNDTYILFHVGETVIELSGEGIDTVKSVVDYTLGDNLENLTLLDNLRGAFALQGIGTEFDNVLIGNLANNVLRGEGADDTLWGGRGLTPDEENMPDAVGNDLLVGGAGHDTYLFKVGDGIDTVEDTALVGEGNRIQFGIGISRSDLTFTHDQVARTLTIQVGSSGTDKLVLTNFDPVGVNGSLVVETLAFADGSTASLADLLSPTINHAPTLATPLVDQTVPEDAPFSVAVPANTFADQDAGAVLTLSASLADGSVLPSWLSFNATTQTFTGIADDAQVGTLDVRVTATDTGTLSVSDVFTFTIQNVNEAPTVAAPLVDQQATQGTLFTVVVPTSTFADVDAGDTLTYSATRADGAALPTWLTFNPSTRTFSGTPQGSDLGTLDVRVTATDAGTLSATDVFALAVLPITGTAGNDSLTGTSGDDVILGLAGDDVLQGLAGNDFLDGGSGLDTMTGGTGNDTYVVDNAGDVVTESANSGTDTVQSTLTYTLGANLENLTLTGSTPINGTGNTLNNVLTGNSANNTLNGGTGADTLIGGQGNDLYVVDNVGDVVTELASEGADLVQSAISYTLGAHLENLTLTGAIATNGTGNALDNLLTGNSGANVLTGGAGNDTYVVSAGDTIIENATEGTDTVSSVLTWALGANLENLTLTGATVINGTGNSLSNVLTGNSAANVLDADGGDDTLNGGAGADTLIGGTGHDIYVVDNVGEVVTEQLNEGTDLVQSSVTYTLAPNVENLLLTGTGAINGTGNGLANTLTGTSGNNTLDGGAGADTLVGGLGNDTYVVDTASDVVTENLTEGTDTVQSSVTYTLNANVENLTLTGTGAINATGNSASNILTGNSGANLLNGGGGTDTLRGSVGDDTYVVDDATDVVTENLNEGTDTVQANLTYTLGTNVENLLLTGTASLNGTGNTLNNVLTGNVAANTLNGGTGADTLLGGQGDDTYVVDNVGDVTTESLNEGLDLVQSSVSYTLSANVENLTLTGSAANTGTGNSLSNTLIGNAGANVLDGGIGADTLVGGAGNDTYVVNDLGDVVTEQLNQGTDTVQSALSYTLGTDLENLTLTGTTALTGTGNALANTLTGNSAANVLSGGDGNDTLDGGAEADTLLGGLGNDTFVVDHANDLVTEALNEGTDTVQSSVTYTLATNVEHLTLTGTATLNGTGNMLNNTLTGNSAANMLAGGAGNDTYVVNTGDTIIENANEGTDTVQSDITWTLGTNLENLTLTGTAAINGAGNSLANTLRGNSAVNVLTGGAANDTYVVSTGDTIIENTNEGTDTVQSDVSWSLGSNLENLTLTGTAASNGTGNSLNNTLTGNVAANQLAGGTGNDTLRGGLGNDTYLVNQSEGQDTISENDGTAGNSDRLLYGATTNPLDLVLSRQVNDLRLAIHGATDYVTVQNWYSAPTTGQVEIIQAGNGQTLLNTQVDQLIQAMAGFSAQTGLTWDQALDQRPQDVQTVLAASWQ